MKYVAAWIVVLWASWAGAATTTKGDRMEPSCRRGMAPAQERAVERLLSGGVSRATGRTGMTVSGRISTFGGPRDTGMRRRETLALYPRKLGRSLNPNDHYIAMRWCYRSTPPSVLRRARVVVEANGRRVVCRPVDWGPAKWTGRAMDLSPGAARALGLRTNQRATAKLIL